MRSLPLILLALSVSLLHTQALSQTKSPVLPEGTRAGGMFSPGMIAGDFLYLSGTLGTRRGEGLLTGIEAQVRQTMENLRRVLDAADMDFSRVVRANVFLSDARHFSAMNAVYREYFPEDPPTRATVEADMVVAGALVEIEMIAALPGADKRMVSPNGLATPPLPFSWGIQAGDTLFVAGATSRSPETFAPVDGDMTTQTRQVLENIGAVLRQADLDYADVVEVTVFLADTRDFAAMNEVFRSFFPEAPPVRATVRAKLMNEVFKLEIQCTAVRGGGRVPVIPAGASRSSPFSPTIDVADRLYIAGFTGRGPDGYAPGDVREQTRAALRRLEGALAAGGLEFSDVVSTRVYLTDIRHFGAMNEVYASVVPQPRPARTTVGTPLMSADALVEIQMLAVKRK